ncbi:hypothetical protein PJN26_11325 [Mycobacterium kansasii]
MTIAVFEDTVRAHFSNPPATWQVQQAAHGWWNVVDNDGALVCRCRSQAQAEHQRHSGPAAKRWHQRCDWYLGYDRSGRVLTAAERLIVADIVELVTAANHAYRQARNIRLVRFQDQEPDDPRIWTAALLANGRYQVRGDYCHTYHANDLDFVDKQALDDLADFLYGLLTAEAS